MNIRFLRTAFLTITLLFAAMIFGQQAQNSKPSINNFLQDKQKIRVVNGSVFANFADQKVTTQEILSDLNNLLKLDENHTFEQISQREDEIGFTHTNFQMLYKGYPVDGHIVMFHKKDGLLQSVNGNVAALKNVDIQINITDSLAINIAKTHLSVKNVFKESTVQTVFTQNPRDKKFYLVKKVRIESFSPFVRYDVFIDANTGEVLNKISLIPRADVQGTANTLFNGVQTITCNQISTNSYELYDNARRIGTYNGTDWYDWWDEPQLYTNTSTTWTNNPAALNVHWGMQKTHDYYQITFSRNSYDGYGGEIYNIYDPVLLDDAGYQFNAGWGGDGMMIYGRGGVGYGYNPFVSLDCAAHELTHGVTEYNGNGGLNYQGESGALNESFSDIFGTCVEFYAAANPNWTIGEDIIIGGYMRSMSNPKASYQPNTYLGDYWFDTNSSDDNGGVHYNSGVQNYWFYLLCQGGSGRNDLGDNYSVTGIGMANAAKIAYRNLMNYLSPYANHIDSYNGSLQAAADLFGNPSAQYTAVKNAWYAVGIDENTTTPTPVGCNEITYLTDASGTFDDGSGDGNYLDNQECWWIISPPGATYVELSFSKFNTEEGWDEVYIFNSTDIYNLDYSNLLAIYSGNRIPNPVRSNTGVMLVVFATDYSVNYSGFTAHYITNLSEEKPFCQSETSVLTDVEGTISDGSGNKNYTNNTDCSWLIAPPNAKSITLNFSDFATEKNYDFVSIYDVSAEGKGLIGKYSGTAKPSPITINSGNVLILFTSNERNTYAGWTLNYSSTLKGEEFEDTQNTIFPNPANNVVNIQFVESQRDAVIEIYDMFGKLIQRYSKQNIPANTIQTLDIEGIPTGIYNISIKSNSKKTNYKLIISR